MIYTCTITPSIDYTTYLPDFETGTLNRTSEVYFYPGGKGINVSRVLQRLNVQSTALGFTGGFTGNFITDFLQREGIKTDFIDTNEITRINVKIKSGEETELNGPGPNIAPKQQAVLLEKINALREGDWFVLAGSLPDSIPNSFYYQIAENCSKQGIRFVLDTSGPALTDLIPTKPFLIKPNQAELGQIFDTEITGKKEALHYASRLADYGIQHVIVSMGKDGALLVSGNKKWDAAPPKGKAVNTVGAGDSLVSGFLASYLRNQNPEEAFRYGVASGSATAFQTDLCNKKDVEALVSEVRLNQL
ncbi:1-phosphofructokinase [Virgibacillus siamensis]|uniref:1-phosphofructokinase n=1 Tax=Virgibacillus siamensis TaxID=480071 RepID=UPI0009861E20|nr:1-phosphofructokinase [Virgibacillus siamensis]